LNVNINISPLPLLPGDNYDVKYAPNLYPLYSFMSIIAGYTFCVLLKKDAYDDPSLVLL